jgi:uncharacterized protein YegP (UPF0339 family)
MYFEIYQENSNVQGKAPEWRWRLKGGNHEIIASGESYFAKQQCINAINLVKSTHKDTPVLER